MACPKEKKNKQNKTKKPFSLVPTCWEPLKTRWVTIMGCLSLATAHLEESDFGSGHLSGSLLCEWTRTGRSQPHSDVFLRLCENLSREGASHGVDKNENSIMLRTFFTIFRSRGVGILIIVIFILSLAFFFSLSLFLSFQVEKEPGFGNFRFNQSLLGDHVPSMFENGDRHRQLKSFLITISQNMLRMGRLIPNIMDIMPEHLIKWNFKEGKYIILKIH